MQIRTRAAARSFLHALACIVTVALGLAACGGGDAPPPPPAAAVAITTQPTDRSVLAGTAATFTVVATGASAYQWQRSGDDGTTFADVAGATGASLTTAATIPADDGVRYRVVVSGAVGRVTSSSARLGVTASPVAATIAVPPAAVTVDAGLAASFAVTAGGTAIQYQWQRSNDGGATFADVAGAQGAVLTLAAAAPGDSGAHFRVVVANSLGSVTSNAAMLTVRPAPSLPAIVTPPASTSVVAPAAASFTVAATGVPAPSLQWQSSSDGGATFTDIPGATGGSYSVATTSVSDNGRQFRVIASNGAGAATSSAATLTVGVQSAPAFTTHPAAVTITEGGNAQLTVAATGVPTPTLQWQLSTDGGASWGNIVGATGDTLPLLGVALANDGRRFRAVASNAAGSVNSNPALLTVQAASSAPRLLFTRGPNGGTDIFAIREDGSGELQLTTTASNNAPRAITAGGRIVYQTANGVPGDVDIASVLMDGTGRVTIANSGDMEIVDAVTPAGRVIYTRIAGAGRKLWSVDADGSNPQPLASTTGVESFAALTSTGKVVYSVDGGGGTPNDLFLVNPDGTGTVALATDPNVYELLYGETSTGQLVIQTIDRFFGTTGSIYTVPANGGAATMLANSLEYSVAGLTRTGKVVLRRDAAGQPPDIYVDGVPVAASGDREIYVGSTASGQVIYQRETPGGGFGGFQTDLYIVNADGTGTVALADATTASESFGGVASDGRIIYGSCNHSDGLCGVYAVNPDGTGRTTLVAPAAGFFHEFTAVTPGGRVIYSRTSGSTGNLFAVNTDGTGTTLLAGGPFFVALTPSGKVLVRNQDNGNANLFIVNADGTASTPLATTPENEFFGGVFGP